MAQASKKVRVFELAKTLDIESKNLLDYCRELGYDVKNQLSSLETDQVEAVKQRISKGGRSAPPANNSPPPRIMAQPVPAAKIEKKIVALPVPKAKIETPAPEPEEFQAEPVVEGESFEPVHEPIPEPVAAEPEPEPAKPAPRPVVADAGRIPNLSKPRPVTPPAPVAPTPVEPEPVADVVTPVAAPEPESAPESVVESPAAHIAETPVPVVETPVVETPATNIAETPVPIAETPVPVTATTPTPATAVPPAFKPKVDLARPQNLSGPRGTAQLRPPSVRPPALARPPVQTPPPVTQSPAASAAPPRPAVQTPPPAGGFRPPVQTPPQGGSPRPIGGAPMSSSGRPPAPGAPRTLPGPGGRPPALGGAGSQQRPGQPGSGGPGQAPRTGAPGAGGPPERNRRTAEQRGPGGPIGPRPTGQPPLRPGQPGTGPAGNRPPGPGGTRPGQAPAPAAGPRKFTPEELEKLRSGKTVAEIKRDAEQVQAPKPGFTPAEEGDEEGEKKKGPGVKGAPAGGGKDQRAKERQIRTEQRKVKTKDVVIGQDGQVDLENENFGSKHGRRAALLKKQKMRQLKGTIERKGKVPITLPITVRSLCEAIGMKSVELLFKLKDLTNSLFTINSTVEVDVAELIAGEKGVELDIQKPKSVEDDLFEEHKEAAEDESKLEPRAPVVTIMGHVDHGKTSLLDRIRKTYGLESNVVASEHGGITQVIRAWRVEKDGKPITFLDTPGHEAFTKMRARGANVTDIAVIVVAADSGVQPQTEEAVSHAKAAGVSIVVAINKMDMPGADPMKVERQMYNLGLLPDNMGGDVQFIRTSAVKGTGIDELLETLALVAEIKDLKANPHKSGQGTCLEANLSGDEGVMATFLVQQGTLRKGDVLVCGAAYGRVRAMYDDLGRPISTAGPSVPVRITGLDQVPNADDHFHVVADLARAREISESRKIRETEAGYNIRQAVKLDSLAEAKTKITELKVILKAEARGSVEAIRKELEKLVHDEVRVRVLHAGIGAITESDVQLALASPLDTLVVGFNVVPDNEAIKLADERDIPIREYQIIYKLTEDIKAAMEGKLKPEERVIHLGRALVRETFKISKVGTVAGCYVTQGNVERSAKIRLIREGVVVFPQGERTAGLDSLKRFKDDVREVKEGYDCGIKLNGYDDIKVGDVIEAYRIEQVKRTL